MEQYSILDLALEVYIPGPPATVAPRAGASTRLPTARRSWSRPRWVEAKVKRSRGTDAEPKVNKKRLQRVAMCFAADHPEVEAISFDVLEVIVGSEATLTFNAAKSAFTWER